MADEQATQSWWKAVPEWLKAVTALIAAVAALLGMLHQTGLLGKEDPPAPSPSAPQAGTAAPNVQPAQAPSPPPSATPSGSAQEIYERLRRAKLVTGADEATMLEWLANSDLRYRRLAEAALAALDGRALARNGADLAKLNYLYVRALGLPDGADMPLGHVVQRDRLVPALIASYNDYNGTKAESLQDIIEPR